MLRALACNGLCFLGRCDVERSGLEIFAMGGVTCFCNIPTLREQTRENLVAMAIGLEFQIWVLR